MTFYEINFSIKGKRYVLSNIENALFTEKIFNSRSLSIS